MDPALKFEPYGLIDTFAKHIIYMACHEAEDKGKDTREHHAMNLYCNVILPFFHDNKYTFCPEFPPAPHSSLRMDMGVQYLVEGEARLRPLKYHEAKRAGKFGTAGKREVEDQAEKKCKVRGDHHKKRLKNHPEELELQHIYTTTQAGYRFGFWVYFPVSQVFRPLFNKHIEYLDPGNEEDAEAIIRSINYIKDYPPFGLQVDFIKPSEEDHSEYSQGTGDPDNDLVHRIIEEGYQPCYQRRMDQEGGVVYYHMVNDKNETIVVPGEEWNRTAVKNASGKEVDYCFTFTQKGTGDKYFVWRLDELQPKDIPLRPQTSNDSIEDSGDQSEESTDLDPDQYLEIFFKAFDKNKNKELQVRFSRRRGDDITWPEADLTRKHVVVNGKRENCVVFRKNDTDYYCIMGAAFIKAAKEEEKNRRRRKGKGKVWGF